LLTLASSRSRRASLPPPRRPKSSGTKPRIKKKSLRLLLQKVRIRKPGQRLSRNAKRVNPHPPLRKKIPMRVMVMKQVDKRRGRGSTTQT